jgi:hypothetical protein
MKVPTPADHLALHAEANGYLYGQRVTHARMFLRQAREEVVPHLKQMHITAARYWATDARKYYNLILYP